MPRGLRNEVLHSLGDGVSADKNRVAGPADKENFDGSKPPSRAGGRGASTRAPRQPGISLPDMAWALGLTEFEVRRRALREGWYFYRDSGVEVEEAPSSLQPAACSLRSDIIYIIDGLPPIVREALLDRLSVVAGEMDSAPSDLPQGSGLTPQASFTLEELASRCGIPIHELRERFVRERWPFRIVDDPDPGLAGREVS